MSLRCDELALWEDAPMVAVWVQEQIERHLIHLSAGMEATAAVTLSADGSVYIEIVSRVKQK